MSDKKEANSTKVLNELIDKGQPPDYMAQEYSSKGEVYTVFAWKCGTRLRVERDTRAEYLETLDRFREFWA